MDFPLCEFFVVKDPSRGKERYSLLNMGSYRSWTFRWPSSPPNRGIDLEPDKRIWFSDSSTDLARRHASILVISCLKNDLKLVNRISTAFERSDAPSSVTE